MLELHSHVDLDPNLEGEMIHLPGLHYEIDWVSACSLPPIADCRPAPPFALAPRVSAPWLTPHPRCCCSLRARLQETR